MTWTLENTFTGVWQALCWLYDILIGFLRAMTNGERALLVANICFAGVGAYSSYLFYLPSRGAFFSLLPATGIELLYIGGAGAAVKYRYQQLIAWALVGIGSLVSAFFGVMVSLTGALPGLFADPYVAPSAEAWIWHGVPAIIEGVIPAVASLLLSVLLHTMVSTRLVEQDKKEQNQRATQTPYHCPFCPRQEETPSKLYGHYGRCTEAKASTLLPDEKKALISKAVTEGNARRI